MSYQITVDQVDERLIAAAKQRTTFRKVSREIRDLLDRPWKLIRRTEGLRTDGDNVAIYWEDAGEGSVEVGVQVTRRFDATEDVICSATPAGTAAHAIHYGHYDQLGEAHRAVRNWCSENGRAIDPPFWEVYGCWYDDWSKVRTDVYYLLK
jgi:effector-binding domain-containing protein